MICAKIPGYVGLLRADGSEPPAASGYKRVFVENMKLTNHALTLSDKQIVFDDVTAPGYGEITAIAVYLNQHDVEPAFLIEFPAVEIHEGIIPLIVNNQLLRGMEVQAQVIMQSADLCGM